MGIRFRKQIGLGPFKINLSRSAPSLTVKVGRWSWNSRTRRHSVDLPGPVSWNSGQPRRTRRGADQ